MCTKEDQRIVLNTFFVLQGLGVSLKARPLYREYLWKSLHQRVQENEGKDSWQLWMDSDNSTQRNKEELQFCQQWPLKHMYLKIFLLQHETIILMPCLFSSVCYSYCDCTAIHLEITFLLRKSHFFFTYSANCLSLLGSEYNELTEIIRTLLFPAQTTKPSSLLAGKYSWGFNVGFTWVQIVEVQALSEHYGWTTVQLFCSKKNNAHSHRGSAHWTGHANHLTCCHATFSMTSKSILLLKR